MKTFSDDALSARSPSVETSLKKEKKKKKLSLMAVAHAELPAEYSHAIKTHGSLFAFFFFLFRRSRRRDHFRPSDHHHPLGEF